MIQTLPTPAILIQGEKVRANLTHLAAYCREHSIRLRPHTKTHKSPFFARMQLDLAAAGLTVAKVGEAQVMSSVCDDILMAYPAVDPLRGQELAHLARTHTIRVAIDSADAARNLSDAAAHAGATLGILVDLDVGLHRTGVQSPQEALALGQLVSTLPHLRLDGIMFYPGHIPAPGTPPSTPPHLPAWAADPSRSHPVAASTESQKSQIRSAAALVAEAVALFDRAGLPRPILSGGSTPTATLSHLFLPHLTEIRPGTYIFNDMNGVRGGLCALDDCAATVIATVVSTAVPDQFVLDCGSKTLTSDRCSPAPESGHGHILEYPLARIVKLTEEHAQVDASLCPTRPRPGDRVTVIPNHICPCINLQSYVYYQPTPTSDPTPLPVEARGKVF